MRVALSDFLNSRRGGANSKKELAWSNVSLVLFCSTLYAISKEILKALWLAAFYAQEANLHLFAHFLAKEDQNGGNIWSITA